MRKRSLMYLGLVLMVGCMSGCANSPAETESTAATSEVVETSQVQQSKSESDNHFSMETSGVGETTEDETEVTKPTASTIPYYALEAEKPKYEGDDLTVFMQQRQDEDPETASFDYYNGIINRIFPAKDGFYFLTAGNIFGCCNIKENRTQRYYKVDATTTKDIYVVGDYTFIEKNNCLFDVYYCMDQILSNYDLNSDLPEGVAAAYNEIVWNTGVEVPADASKTLKILDENRELGDLFTIDDTTYALVLDGITFTGTEYGNNAIIKGGYVYIVK